MPPDLEEGTEIHENSKCQGHRGTDIQTQAAGSQGSGSEFHYSTILQPHISCSAQLCALYVGSAYELHRLMFIQKKGVFYTHGPIGF